MKKQGKGWYKDYYEHAMAARGVKTKKCNVTNPMNTRSNRELLFGHFLTHTHNYQKSVGLENAKCEHDRLVKIMNKRGMSHNSPFKKTRPLQVSGIKTWDEGDTKIQKHILAKLYPGTNPKSYIGEKWKSLPNEMKRDIAAFKPEVE